MTFKRQCGQTQCPQAQGRMHHAARQGGHTRCPATGASVRERHRGGGGGGAPGGCAVAGRRGAPAVHVLRQVHRTGGRPRRSPGRRAGGWGAGDNGAGAGAGGDDAIGGGACPRWRLLPLKGCPQWDVRESVCEMLGQTSGHAQQSGCWSDSQPAVFFRAQVQKLQVGVIKDDKQRCKSISSYCHCVI